MGAATLMGEHQGFNRFRGIVVKNTQSKAIKRKITKLQYPLFSFCYWT
jgi:hypothetical protein